MRRFVRRFGRHLLYGWGKRRLPYEAAILQAVRAAMSEADRGVFDAQMNALERVQRWSGGRVLRLSIDPDAATLPCFADMGQEHCLARITVRCGRQRHTALLISNRGRINTLEFKRSPRSLRAGGYEIRDVTLNAKERSVAQAIDRLGHGRNSEEDA